MLGVFIGVVLVARSAIGSPREFSMGGEVALCESICEEKWKTCVSAIKRRVNHDKEHGRSFSERERHTPGKRRMGVHRCHPWEVASFSDLVSEVVSTSEGLFLEPKFRLARGGFAFSDGWSVHRLVVRVKKVYCC